MPNWERCIGARGQGASQQRENQERVEGQAGKPATAGRSDTAIDPMASFPPTSLPPPAIDGACGEDAAMGDGDDDVRRRGPP